MLLLLLTKLPLHDTTGRASEQANGKKKIIETLVFLWLVAEEGER